MSVNMLTLSSTATLSSGYEIPRIGFGVYRNEGNTCYSSVLKALEVGYRHIDTAQMYANESEVGAALKDSGVDRKEVFITTKIEHKDYGYVRATETIDESLVRLGTDYIDLMLLHEPYSGLKNRIDTYQALITAKEAGKIRSVGVSNFSALHIQQLLDAGLPAPCVNQIELHPFCQMKHVVPFCKEKGILVEAFCPLVRAGKDNHSVIQKLASKHKKSPAQILIRWSLQNGYVPLPKSATPSRIVANAEVYDFELDEKDMKEVDGLDEGKAGSISWWPYDEE